MVAILTTIRQEGKEGRCRCRCVKIVEQWPRKKIEKTAFQSARGLRFALEEAIDEQQKPTATGVIRLAAAETGKVLSGLWRLSALALIVESISPIPTFSLSSRIFLRLSIHAG